jgi:hypothetical protein
MTSLSKHRAELEVIKFSVVYQNAHNNSAAKCNNLFLYFLSNETQIKLKTRNSRDILIQLNGSYFKYLSHSL